MKRSIKEIADVLDQAAHQVQAVEQISKQQAINLSEAYHVQKLSLENRYARGEHLTGYKLGFTSKAKMEQMGLHDIIWGRLTDAMQIKIGDQLKAANFIHPRVEPEIAFLIGKEIDRPIKLEEATDFLEGVASALEIIDSRYQNFKFSLEDVIADNCSSSAYILGDWLAPTTVVSDLSISLKINGELKQKGNSNAILDNPMESLVEISRLLNENGITVAPGTIILAGAATSAEYIHAGDEVEGVFEGLSSIQFKVV